MESTASLPTCSECTYEPAMEMIAKLLYVLLLAVYIHTALANDDIDDLRNELKAVKKQVNDVHRDVCHY